jgi:galactokinase
MQAVYDGFRKVFGTGSTPRIFFAPGRVNLIGEHIDYNGGLVLPVAINMGTYVAVVKRNDSLIRVASGNFPGLHTWEAGDPVPSGWQGYPLGVAAKMGFGRDIFAGCDMYFHGDLPVGNGLSSSASVCMAAITALDSLFDTGLDIVQKVEICQAAERANGVNCGVMDFFASAAGKAGHAVLIDCARMSYRHIPLNLQGYKIVIAGSNKPRQLMDSAYNSRRRECEEALAALQSVLPVKSLCEISPQDFEWHKRIIPSDTARRRAEHAVYEQARVVKTVELIAQDRWREVLPVMVESHASLRDLFQVSCDELNALFLPAFMYGVTPPDGPPPIYATRMTGAGFGGCTVNIVRQDAIDDFITQVGSYYAHETNLIASFYETEAADGAREIA